MAEERKRTTRARSTSSNSTSRRSSSAKQPSQRTKRASSGPAEEQTTQNPEVPTTPGADDTTNSTLGAETWRPEMRDGETITDDAPALETDVPVPVAEFDSAATEGATPAQNFVPTALPRQEEGRTTGLGNIATPMTTGETAFSLADASTTPKLAAPTPLPRIQGKTTAPMPMTTGQATVPMPMMQPQSGKQQPLSQARRAKGATSENAAPPPQSPPTPNATLAQQTAPETRHGLPFDERWLTLIGGGALTVAGVLRRGWPGAIMGIAGAGLLARGIIQTIRGRTHYAAITVDRTIIINRTPEDLYHFWRNLENLPRFIRHLEEVTALDVQRSHWRVQAPAGMTVAWDANITKDEPNCLIAWESAHDAQVQNAGIVTFALAPGGRGTEVHVRLRYLPPAGKVGAVVAALFGDNPDQQVHEDLRHLKEVLETGEIPTTAGQPSGRRH